MTTRLHATRTSYDTVAADYAELFKDLPVAKPLDMAMLAVFAERVRAGGGGAVADLGCGPGRVTVHLERLGLDAFGIDLSPGMVAVARRAHPHLRFEAGTMTGLDIPDGTLAGALVWYSTVHTPIDELPVMFAEFHRVLAPGGHLLIAFKAGDGQVRLEHAYGHDVDLDVHRFPPERVAGLLRAAGLPEVARLVREADDREKTPQAFILARRAEDPLAPATAP
ncbi:class I SAM-dependent DNA methyltransferase [Streptomyces triticiradicis]|uniref:Class I SAM-dependent methyltransferase n=1 Tax=Streptomyces triticiradicis TaxID=2651189 RepID=A0A7J5DDP6_9ACTN|nr:class I SAM-dependent methyltransferase [Streptomyces triticiradicis]KAB1986961.1 class I SAM-dependent methyltransferase [Streptomyces triticiradicis]